MLYHLFIGQITEATKSWIITHGTNACVTKHFAEENVCVGIAPWGNIYNRKQLENAGSTVVYERSGIFSRDKGIQGESLNKHHTNFFLVDNGYVNKPEGEMEFRAKFERAVHSSNDIWRGNS